MKTITLDYETYQLELRKAMEKGKSKAENLLPRADKIIKEVKSGYYTSKIQQEMNEWLYDYSHREDIE